jgi:integrase
MHDIRRTFATELYYAGIGISQIRAWMGHSSEAQTYQYICYRDDPEDVRKLEFIG